MLYPGEEVTDDSNYRKLIGDGTKVFVAGEMRLLSAIPTPPAAPGYYGAKKFSADFQVIPRSEWSARIKEMEERESRLSDLLKWPALDQDGIPYCWIYGCVGALMAARSAMGLPDVMLSPESAGSIITGGVSRGGYGGEGLKYLSEVGCCRQDLWPAHSIRTSNENEQTKADKANHRIVEFWQGDDNNFDQIMTLAFHRIPSPVGLDWWRHLVFGCDPVEIEPGSFGLRIRNSHSNNEGAANKHGVRGFRVLQESRARGDFFGIRQATASSN